jgi:DNA-binding transcriptional regulator YiaG
MEPNITLTNVEVAIPTPDGLAISEYRTVQVPAYPDPVTGELVLTGEAIQLIDDAKARFMGVLLPKEIRAVRKRLGLTQAQIAELLQAGAKTYTRWENGRCRPSRLANMILCALRDGRLDVSYLRSVLSGPFDWRPKVIHYNFRKPHPVTFKIGQTNLSESNETVAVDS